LVRVAGTDDRGIDKGIDPVGRDDQLRVGKLHPDSIAGKDVRHIHLENVRPLLFQKGGSLPVV
jgi:hypothetical protein